MYLLPERKCYILLCAIVSAIVERIDTVGVVLNPRQAIGVVGCGVEYVVAISDAAGFALFDIHIA
jgi:hypothetical protein